MYIIIIYCILFFYFILFIILKNLQCFIIFRNWIHIAGIEDNVVVMPSLQRPRRITLKGSDGKEYLFMCKPKDDLRRDFRLMEFNDIVNKYLQNDPESRQRRLYIRTYVSQK